MIQPSPHPPHISGYVSYPAGTSVIFSWNGNLRLGRVAVAPRNPGSNTVFIEFQCAPNDLWWTLLFPTNMIRAARN